MVDEPTSPAPFLEIKNWDIYRPKLRQNGAVPHYIKTMVNIEDDRDFATLTVLQRYICWGCWRVRARTGRRLFNDADHIARALRIPSGDRPHVRRALDTLIRYGFLIPCWEQASESTTATQPEAPDPKHVAVREEIWKAYQTLNARSCPWSPAHSRNLALLLKSSPTWTIQQWVACVRNRFSSDAINFAEDPLRWIGKLANYGAGPLDRYNRRKAEATSGPDVGGEEYWRLRRAEIASGKKSSKMQTGEDRKRWRAEVIDMVKARLASGVPLERCGDLTKLCDKSMLEEATGLTEGRG
jgi:hypothetical protein